MSKRKRTSSEPPRRTLRVAGFGILLLTVLVFSPVRRFDFVNYDDFEFVVENRHVSTGISAANITWAFANAYTATGGPLTWLSHMLDAELFGLDAGLHHLTSVALHVCNALLLFTALWKMTAAIGRSACVAALFAVHPLHVESVAWIAERKDVLSTLFWMLGMLAYVRYVRGPSTWRYVIVAACLALGLLSKPMVATLPFVLLLLDVWPLGRVKAETARRLILEKLPLLAMSVAAIALALAAQRRLGAVATVDALPLSTRVANAALSYIEYVRQMFWPVGLAAFYPYRLEVSPVLATACAIAVAAVTVAAIRSFRRTPYLTVGWLWYVGTLVPVIGIVQLGSHAMADRFTYLPLIGLFLAAVWGGTALLHRAGALRAASPTVAVCLIAASAVVSSRQVYYWQNGIALWTHAAEVTSGNARAHANLGVSFAREGQRSRAIQEYVEALRIDPRYAEAHNNLALALVDDRQPDKAGPHFQEAIRLQPTYANAHMNLANLLDEQGRADEAVSHYREAIRLDPTHVLARVNLAVALARAGKVDEAIVELEAALQIDAGNDAARKMLEEMKRARS